MRIFDTTIYMSKEMRYKVKLYLGIFVFVCSLAAILFVPKEAESGTLDSASNTLSNSRLSYEAGVSTTISSGATTITIDGAGNPDNDTNHLFPGDTVCFSDSQYNGCHGSTTYTVGRVINSTTFTITSGLTTGLTGTDLVVATQSATHTVDFTTVSSVANGSILVRIPAVTATATSNDGFADQGTDSNDTQGFDLNGLANTDVACTGGGVTWSTSETVSDSAATGGEHEITFPYTGTLAASQAIQCTIGGALVINPAPATDHTQGTADDLQITVEQYDNNVPASGNLVDTVDIAVAPIESVFVSATVDETLDFAIGAVGTGATACGANPDIASTVTTVPFGTLSLNTFVDLAHDLQVSTNASEGYSVTTIASNQMGKDGAACTGDAGTGNDCIPDTTCDGASCDHTAANVDDWETNTNNGFGYSLESTDGTDAVWEYDGTSGTCDGAGSDFCAAQFADAEQPQSAVTIMTNAGPVNSSNIYVCYRISVGATQPAGYYYNTVKYTATATF